MAAHNEEAYLRDAVESVLAQTVSNFEYIVVDDGSTDRTLDLLHSFNDERLEIVSLPERLGRAAARNHALERAQGKYVGFMDADDVTSSNRLEKQLRFLEAHPEIDGCGTALETFGGDLQETWRPPCEPERLHAQLLFECPFFLPTALLRKRTIDRNKLRFDPEFKCAEDYDFWVRTARCARIANLDEVLYRYRFNLSERTHTQQQNERESRSIQKRQLQTLGLSPNTRQFVLHTALCKPQGYAPQSGRDVADLIRWLDLIVAQNQKQNLFTHQALTETIEHRLDEILADVPNRRMGLLRCLDSKIVRRRLYRMIRRSIEDVFSVAVTPSTASRETVAE